MTTATLRAQAPDGTDPTQALALVRRLATRLGNRGFSPVILNGPHPMDGLAMGVLVQALADTNAQNRALRAEVAQAWHGGGLQVWLAHLDLSPSARARIEALFEALLLDLA